MRTASRLFVVLALATLLAGCDKCGNWFFTSVAPFGPEACRTPAPSQK